MPADSTRHSSQFDASVVDQLACPACLGDLSFERSELVCARCKRAYPIVDRIPVLIVGRESSRSLLG